MSEQLEQVQHDYIRYANCWEDADVLLQGLQVQSGDKVLSIGSAGDNSFSLLTNDPQFVIAVDINRAQLNLIELKKASFRTLSYEQFLEFLGFKESNDRFRIFQLVKENLSKEQKVFWESRADQIEAGIIFQGKFERYFRFFRSIILPLIHSKNSIDKLFLKKKKEQQTLFYNEVWNNWQWRMLFKLFFSKTVMGKAGRDPAFLKEVEVSVSKFIFNKARNELNSVECQRNYFLEFILKGKFSSHLPHYARQENFDKIKSNVNNLFIFQGLAEDAFQQYSGFNRFNLSNIFEYMDLKLFQIVVKNLVNHGSPGARYVYWNLMVQRKMANINPQLENDAVHSKSLTGMDKCFFYSNVNIDVRK